MVISLEGGGYAVGLREGVVIGKHYQEEAGHMLAPHPNHLETD